MSEFTSVDRGDLQLAFVKAYRASESDYLYSDRVRQRFKEIAELIRPFLTSAELEAAISIAHDSIGCFDETTPSETEQK